MSGDSGPVYRVLDVESYDYGTLSSQVPIRKMEHGSTVKINFAVSCHMLVTEISGS